MGVTYGEWLRAKRGQRGEPGFITQATLAERIGAERTFIVQLENSNKLPTYATRQKVHAALGTTEAELIDLGIVRGSSHDGAREAMRQQPAQPAQEPSPLARALDAIWHTMNAEQRAFAKNVLDAALSVPRDAEDREDRRVAESGERYKP